MMFRINLVMMAVVALLTPVSLIFSQLISRKSYEKFSESVSLRGDLSELVEESVTQNELLCSLIYMKVNNIFDEINEEYSYFSEKATFHSSLLVNPITRFINVLIYAGVTFMGVLF